MTSAAGDPIEPTTLEAGDLTLRPWRPADAPAVARICADPDIQRWIPVPSPYTLADAETWIASGPAGWAEGRRVAWAVVDAADTVLASVALHDLDRGYPELGYWCAPEARGRGVTTAAARAACRWALDRGAPKVLWLADVGNEGSWRVAHKAGFVFEGRRLAECAHRDGSRTDAWAGSLLPGGLDRPVAAWPYEPLPALVDGPVSLRRWRPEDAADLHRLRSEPTVAGWDAYRLRESVESLRASIAGRYVEQWAAGTGARLAVCAEDVVVGGVSLRTPTLRFGEGELGWWLGEASRRRGSGTRAVRLLAAWAFDGLGLDRLRAGVHAENLPSQALAERVGFVREGLLRQEAPAFDGGKGDGLVYGLLPADLR